ncbi:DNA/RNA non-specific endonuclease [Lactococcus insecticola]|uniref:DNAse n=1 Tax=Pseudolactococcus insecticola TaxID=2709158 RepID=A0A6A0BAI7_9LACT|nr:DNA/RNA non-specific endonuclease [Lactococcus insecticola]GFH41394.1 DNAse [Lactococcus insecticola]
MVKRTTKQLVTLSAAVLIGLAGTVGKPYIKEHTQGIQNYLNSKLAPVKAKLANNTQQSAITPQTASKASEGLQEQKPLSYTGHKQFVMSATDQYGRAVDSHIQLQASDEPGHNGQSRAPLTYNPVGWHNYKLSYDDNGKTGKAWLFDRGHLVGYQFSGVNDEPRNLVPETSQLNKGNIAHMDSGNDKAMLFYENRLDSWLELHPNYFLDYQVTPIYTGSELLPRQVRLAYVGVDSKGNHLQIKLGGSLEEQGNDDATVVVLDNVSSNATIDYATGMATQK